jgi:outer membrane autotransporter protein
VQAGLSVGASTSKQELPLGGRSDADTTFAVLEGLYNIPSTRLWASASLLYLTGDIEARRVYGVNGDDTAVSTGRPDVEGSGIRLRLDWENAARFAGVALTPYTDVSYVQTKIDAYTESGGSFPARFNERTEDSTEWHLGVDGSYALSSATRLVGRVEYAHRFEKNGAGTSGTVLGLFDFSFAGIPVEQDWLRLGFGADMKLGPGVASAMLNATSRGSAPSYWLNLSYQLPF